MTVSVTIPGNFGWGEGVAECESGQMIERSDAVQLDANDPLARWRDEFVIPDPELIYLDGNSLGRTPKRTAEALHRVIDEWSGDLISSWWEHDWLNLALTVGDELAPLLGAAPGEVAVHESTTVGIFQQVNVALDLVGDGGRRNVVAIADEDFPTDRYVVEGIARLRDVEVRHGLDDLDGVDVVLRSLVDYRTAELADLAGETERARAAGATTVWDLSHAAGVLQLDLAGAGVDLAVGCTYKFLNGGPGAPAFVYVSDRVTRPRDAADLGMVRADRSVRHGAPLRPTTRRRTHAQRHAAGTRPDGCARRHPAVGRRGHRRDRRRRPAALTGFGIDLADQFGFENATPRDPLRRGGHVAIRHSDARQLHGALGERKVIIDRRDPDILRFGMSPLTTSYADVYDAFAALADLVASLD